MCIASLYDIDPKRRAKLACLESLIRMRDEVCEVDAINKFMPAAGDRCVTPSLHNASVAGSYSIQGEAA